MGYILPLHRGLILKQFKLFTWHHLCLPLTVDSNIMLGSIFFFLTVNHLFPIFALRSVTKDNVSAGQSLSLTHVLAKRDWFPTDQTCHDPEDWHSRSCVAQAVDRIWYDTCVDIDEDVSYGLGICPEDTICMNTYGPEPDQTPTIACVIRPTCDACKPSITGGPPPANGQTGTYRIGTNDNSIKPPLRAVSVTMESSISGASVTAFIEGTYQTSQLTLTCRVFLLSQTIKVPMEIIWSHLIQLCLVPCVEQMTRLVLTMKQIGTVCPWEHGILKPGTLSTSRLASALRRL